MAFLWPDWDLRLFLGINGLDWGPLTVLMRAVSNVDNWIPVILGGVLLLLWMGRTRPRLLRDSGKRRWSLSRNPRTVILCLILAATLSDQVCYHVKHQVGRPRPCFDETVSNMVLYRGEVYGNRSFPSAHSSNSAALATVVSIAYPAVAVPAVLTALTVGFSRIYLGVHYPLDVFVGWGTGVLAGLLAWMLLGRASRRQGPVGFTNRFRYRQPPLKGPPPEGWREVVIPSADGCQTTGLFLQGGEDLAVLVHGLHGDIRNMVLPGEVFQGLGYSVLAVPLRGHDGHPVPVTSGGPAEVLDLLGAICHAQFSMGFSRERMIVYGSSMGAAVAMKAAGLLGGPLGGVIAHSPYVDFFNSARARLGRFREALLRLLIPVAARRGLDTFRPAEYALTASGTRFVFMCGSIDRISPPGICTSLSEGQPGASVVLLEGAGHPVWYRTERAPDRFRGGIRQAVGLLSGNLAGGFRVDETGTVRNLRAVDGDHKQPGEP